VVLPRPGWDGSDLRFPRFPRDFDILRQPLVLAGYEKSAFFKAHFDWHRRCIVTRTNSKEPLNKLKHGKTFKRGAVMETIESKKGLFGRSGCAIRLVLVLSALFALPSAFAGGLSLLANGTAIHTESPKGTDLNENNTGFGFQYDFGKADRSDYWAKFTTVSGFKDSVNNMSYYAGMGVMHRIDVSRALDLHVGFGGVVFLMTRKDLNDNSPFPGALPAFEIGTRHATLNITYVPKIDERVVPLWFIQLKIPFDTHPDRQSRPVAFGLSTGNSSL
jgi:hypothetical protein